MTSLFIKYEQKLSCSERRSDDLFRNAASCCDSISPVMSDVLAILADVFLDQAKLTQKFQVAGDSGNVDVGQEKY